MLIPIYPYGEPAMLAFDREPNLDEAMSAYVQAARTVAPESFLMDYINDAWGKGSARHESAKDELRSILGEMREIENASNRSAFMPSLIDRYRRAKQKAWWWFGKVLGRTTGWIARQPALVPLLSRT